MGRCLRGVGAGGATGFALAHAVQSGAPVIWVGAILFLALQVAGFLVDARS